MPRIFSLQYSDGGVEIYSLNDGYDPDTEIAKLESTRAIRYPGSRLVTKRQIFAADIPARDEFRNAWKDNGSAIAVDIEKAKEITKERLRRERDALFAKNDVALLSAIADNNMQAKMAAISERERLKDITKRADAAVSIDELKALKAAK